MGWAGLATIGAAAAMVTEASPFPGALALAPTLATVALIAAGTIGAGPARLLALPPLRGIGEISYSLYLWHWPLLVAATAYLGELSTAAGLLVVLASGGLAALTYWFVENPVRHARTFVRRPARALRLGLAGMGAAALAGLLFQLTVWPAAVAPGYAGWTSASSGPVGAAVLGPVPGGDPAGDAVDRVDAIHPDPVAARKDIPAVYADGCVVDRSDSEVRTCRYGDPRAAFTVALVGDSHAAQWLPAVERVAQVNAWRVVTYVKAACPLVGVTVALSGRPYPSCADWNARVLARLTGGDRPDLVVTSSSYYQPIRDGATLAGDAARATLADGFRRAWSALAATGVPVVVLRGTPQPGIDIAECVARHPAELTRCAVARGAALAGIGPAQAQAATGLARVSLVDLNDAICPGDPCAAVIGGILVYRDNNHVTATYIRSLAPRLRAALDAALRLAGG
jgi:hypothetical protein